MTVSYSIELKNGHVEDYYDVACFAGLTCYQTAVKNLILLNALEKIDKIPKRVNIGSIKEYQLSYMTNRVSGVIKKNILASPEEFLITSVGFKHMGVFDLNGLGLGPIVSSRVVKGSGICSYTCGNVTPRNWLKLKNVTYFRFFLIAFIYRFLEENRSTFLNDLYRTLSDKEIKKLVNDKSSVYNLNISYEDIVVLVLLLFQHGQSSIPSNYRDSFYFIEPPNIRGYARNHSLGLLIRGISAKGIASILSGSLDYFYKYYMEKELEDSVENQMSILSRNILRMSSDTFSLSSKDCEDLLCHMEIFKPIRSRESTFITSPPSNTLDIHNFFGGRTLYDKDRSETDKLIESKITSRFPYPNEANRSAFIKQLGEFLEVIFSSTEVQEACQ